MATQERMLRHNKVMTNDRSPRETAVENGCSGSPFSDSSSSAENKRGSHCELTSLTVKRPSGKHRQ